MSTPSAAALRAATDQAIATLRDASRNPDRVTRESVKVASDLADALAAKFPQSDLAGRVLISAASKLAALLAAMRDDQVPVRQHATVLLNVAAFAGEQLTRPSRRS